jgi:hypothetical protein
MSGFQTFLGTFGEVILKLIMGQLKLELGAVFSK